MKSPSMGSRELWGWGHIPVPAGDTPQACLHLAVCRLHHDLINVSKRLRSSEPLQQIS